MNYNFHILKHMKQDEIMHLCDKINMPGTVAGKVADLCGIYDFSKIQPYFNLLFDLSTGEEGVKSISGLIANDIDSEFIWLAVWLSAALCAKELYGEMRMDDAVFYATMGCFSRYVKEHMESYGIYGFDRSIWTYRHTSMAIFRLGELEFEKRVYNGEDKAINGETVLRRGDNTLSIHIPSDAKLTAENCRKSYEAAMEFFDKYYPDFGFDVFYCSTWLLSPNLKYVLPQGSNILNFQKDFELCSFETESTGYKKWVFKNPNLNVDDYPENTSLQRNIKQYVKNGGGIGSGECIIRKSTLR